MDKRVSGCICAFLCEMLFGLSYVFTKDITARVSALSLLSWRFITAFAFMIALVFAKAVRIEITKEKAGNLLKIALFNPLIYFIAETYGIRALTASESGALLASIPVFSIIASAVFLKSKPGKTEVIGILITLIGVLFTVFASGFSASFSISGYFALFLAVISYALYSVFSEKGNDSSEMEKTFFMMLLGAIVFPALAVIESLREGRLSELITLPFKDMGFLIAVLYQGIGCSSVAFFLSNAAIARIGVNRSSTFIGITTAVSILGGVLMLNEPFTLMQITGSILILIGVYTANIRR